MRCANNFAAGESVVYQHRCTEADRLWICKAHHTKQRSQHTMLYTIFCG